ncbi:hypothetical protein H9N25_00785 [Pedobacter riviphilus]|uniref:Lipoprotein n=1 Tax=Pedobacter riviphilus TaxID=2766984 RepID=A0ABX6TJH6_9SPHI|nr:hypothetical protein [Pedobacter riviphilus]QNR85078.1 hypothetical protein H9N25_00785 [Pedobacter riviphilus]
MRKLLFINFIIIGFSVLTCSAQKNLGVEKSKLMDQFSSDKSKEFLSVGKSLDNQSYVTYRDAERFKLRYIYHFDKAGICIADGLIMPSVNYPDLIKVINKDSNNKMVEDDIWENKVKNLRISIRPIPSTTDIIFQYSKLN